MVQRGGGSRPMSTTRRNKVGWVGLTVLGVVLVWPSGEACADQCVSQMMQLPDGRVVVCWTCCGASGMCSSWCY